MNNPSTTAIFPKGNPVPAEYFTGTVTLTTLVNRDQNNDYVVGNVAFEPSARTNWHTHPKGQNLLVIHGMGFYQEKNGPVRSLEAGDVVIIPENVEHWHGAAPNSHFAHIAITNFKDGVNVVWLKPVTEDEYNQASKADFSGA